MPKKIYSFLNFTHFGSFFLKKKYYLIKTAQMDFSKSVDLLGTTAATPNGGGLYMFSHRFILYV